MKLSIRPQRHRVQSRRRIGGGLAAERQTVGRTQMASRNQKSQRNRIDEMANRLAQAGRVEEIERELERFDPKRLEGAELESWYHIWGIEAFRRGGRRQAFARFQEARNACQNSNQIAFSLAQEHEFRGEAAEMFSLFDACRFPKVPASYALAQARYAYLWSDLTRAQAYIAPIFEAYWSLRIADDTFLYLRGLPFFSQTWAYAAAFQELSGRLDQLEKETREAAGRLVDFDGAPAVKFVQAVRANDFSEYLREPGRGTAYERTRAAVLLSSGMATQEDAAVALNDVKLGPGDFPWLSDMVLLARCAAASRWGDPREESLAAEFFLKQPLLFEPDHAFNFRLLGYQEKLKARYRQNRCQGAAQPAP
ncbi:MAG TPA: hypothetical protein VJ860_20680 [Polyangia bacterium]|nr:hypothetical protein [Polyangia bacterium]